MAAVYLGTMAAAFLIFLRKKHCRKYAAIVLAGSMASLCMWAAELSNVQNAAVTTIFRSKDNQKMELLVKAEEKEAGILLEIERQTQGKEELRMLEKELWNRLEQELLGKNKSYDYVTEPLYFPEQISGYPFILAWDSEKPELLRSDGTLGEKIPQEGECVSVTVRIDEAKSGFEADRTFYVKVYPSQTWAAYIKRLERYLKESQALTTKEESYLLPSDFEGKELVFEAKQEKNSPKIFLLLLFGAAMMFWAMKQEETKKKNQEREELEREYPKLAVRMAMLADTGLTVSGALRRIAGEYEKRNPKKKQPLYEELLIVCREMESGVSEKAAYQNLAGRCAVPCITRFSALLIQYVQSGASGLKRVLKEEAERALKEKRERIRKKGEEAGTKLLMPMILLLVLVMVIVMIPAITSFGL